MILSANVASELLEKNCQYKLISESSQTLFKTGTFSVLIKKGDFNNDHKLDLVVVNKRSNTLSILLNSCPCSLNTFCFPTRSII